MAKRRKCSGWTTGKERYKRSEHRLDHGNQMRTTCSPGGGLSTDCVICLWDAVSFAAHQTVWRQPERLLQRIHFSTTIIIAHELGVDRLHAPSYARMARGIRLAS